MLVDSAIPPGCTNVTDSPQTGTLGSIFSAFQKIPKSSVSFEGQQCFTKTDSTGTPNSDSKTGGKENNACALFPYTAFVVIFVVLLLYSFFYINKHQILILLLIILY